jgi:hypothetical protein
MRYRPAEEPPAQRTGVIATRRGLVPGFVTGKSPVERKITAPAVLSSANSGERRTNSGERRT